MAASRRILRPFKTERILKTVGKRQGNKPLHQRLHRGPGGCQDQGAVVALGTSCSRVCWSRPFPKRCQPCCQAGHSRANLVPGQLCCWWQDLRTPLKCYGRWFDFSHGTFVFPVVFWGRDVTYPWKMRIPLKASWTSLKLQYSPGRVEWNVYIFFG